MPDFPYLPLGYRCDGRPIFGFQGGDGEGDGDGGSDSDGDGDGGGTAETDPVKRLESTLAKVITERKEVRDEFRPWKAALRELGVQNPDQLKEMLGKGSGSGAPGTGKQEPVDIEAVRKQARDEIRLEANRDVALAQVEAAAKGMFADPEDAVSHLRGSVDDLLGRDGKPDKKAIERELGDLLAAKPHWGVVKDGPASFDGGARQAAGGKQTMDSWLRDRSRQKRG